MGKKVYQATSLTGGATGALDAINGSLLADGDLAIVTYGGRAYLYELDHDNSSAEASPWIICPDKNYGTKRWVLQPPGSAYWSVSRACLASNQTGIAHNASPPTKVLLDTETHDPGSCFASYKWTAPINCYVHCDFGVANYDLGAKLTLALALLYLDGAVNAQGNWAYASNVTYLKSTGSADIGLSAGQYIELFGYGQTSDASTFDYESGAHKTFLNVRIVG